MSKQYPLIFVRLFICFAVVAVLASFLLLPMFFYFIEPGCFENPDDVLFFRGNAMQAKFLSSSYDSTCR